jgi:hypothetical protein
MLCCLLYQKSNRIKVGKNKQQRKKVSRQTGRSTTKLYTQDTSHEQDAKRQPKPSEAVGEKEKENP